MKALVTTGVDGNGLAFVDVDEPKPHSNQTVVRLRATSVNRGEVAHLRDEDPGQVLGWDVAGDVVQPAADGSGPSIGQRVVGIVDDHAWAELVCVPTHAMSVLPDEVTYAAASVLPIAGLTAWRALELGGFLLGRRVLVTGGAGGVGRLAIQLARLSGAHVTAVVGRPERVHGLRELGAAEVVVGIENASGRFDVILESAGGASLARSMEVLSDEGILITYGRSSGEPAKLDSGWFGDHSGARIEGLLVFTEIAQRRLGTKQLDGLVRLVASGSLDPQIVKETSWRDPMPVVDELLARTVPGKVVLRVD
ncbi:MAG TPA: zinc-binding dehydrogenase [Actinomycetes bacterium]|nr:zinc-binding dehydrogenase [Actinomycetes bacterium]